VHAVKQRWALVAMGAWLIGTVLVSVVASENFYTIDRLMTGSTSVGFSGQAQKLGYPLTRELLRYLSSELNRLYFQLWNVAQLVIGALVLWLIARDRSLVRARWAVVAMLASVVLMVAWLTPAIVSLGRELDFVPRNPAPPGMRRFWMLHAVDTTLEMAKLFVGIVVTFWIVRPPVPRLGGGKPD
jgi:hypothetical protein